jgi:hypothetical protein
MPPVGFAPYFSCNAPQFGCASSPVAPLCLPTFEFDLASSVRPLVERACPGAAGGIPKFPGVTSAALTGVSMQDNHRYVGATIDGMNGGGGGMWFSTPEVGECPFDAPFRSSGLTGSSGQGCVWRMRPVVRLIRFCHKT